MRIGFNMLFLSPGEVGGMEPSPRKTLILMGDPDDLDIMKVNVAECA